MAPWHWPYRAVYLVCFLVCGALMAYALYAEYRLGLAPCPLCIFQRVAFIWMGVWFLVGGLHAPRGNGRWAYVVLVLIGAVFGVAMAGRQLWLQSLPADQIPACGAGFDMLLAQLKGHYIPLSQFVTTMLRGSGDCAQVTWKFLGLSMAGWTLIWYVVLGIWALLPRPRGNKLVGAPSLRAMRN